MKKQITLGIALLMLLSILSGCGSDTAAPTTLAPETTAAAEAAPTPVGTLYVSFGAALEITYDEEGNALTLTGVNEAGKLLAEAKQDQLNKGCVYTLRSILRMVIDQQLLGDAKTVTVRIGAEDPLPTEDFLQTIGQDCQYLIDEEGAGVDIYCLTGDKLDETGNLTYETAQMLASKYLGAEATAAETTATDVYAFTAGEKTCTVDAFTGLILGQ